MSHNGNKFIFLTSRSTESDAGVSEDIAHFYFRQLISGVTYMHSKGIGHRGVY